MNSQEFIITIMYPNACNLREFRDRNFYSRDLIHTDGKLILLNTPLTKHLKLSNGGAIIHSFTWWLSLVT